MEKDVLKNENISTWPDVQNRLVIQPTWEDEADIVQVQGKPGQFSETLSQNKEVKRTEAGAQ